MDFSDYINIAAIILAPIVSVIVGQKLQDRARKRDDKMQVFKILMSSRIYGWTNASVEALNLIEVIFAKDKKVITQWKKYYDVLGVENPDATQREKMVKERDALLEVIAISLGYKDNVTLRTIQNSYQPVGLADMLKKQRKLQVQVGHSHSRNLVPNPSVTVGAAGFYRERGCRNRQVA